jgi:N-acetyl-anhydromuramyl-L-alanine amidase AmpD
MTTAKTKRISKLISQDWPSDHAARIDGLRKSAGSLPLYQRYLDGDYLGVWADLSECGDAVWYDPLAADALAVTFETMHRARRNVETIVQRLDAIGYRFHREVFSP